MKTKLVKLTSPITGSRMEPVVSVALREPSTGDMRGLKLTDVMQMDVATMTRLIPRVSEPALAPSEIEALPGSDFVALASGVIGFFFTEEQITQEAARLS